MIQPHTRLIVADNSGAKEIECIKTLYGVKRDAAQLGDVIVASVKTAVPNAPVKKKEVVRAVIVRQKQPFRRQDGTYIRFDDNAVVIIDKEDNLRGSRIFGPVASEVKKRGLQKIISQAPEVL